MYGEVKSEIVLPIKITKPRIKDRQDHLKNLPVYGVCIIVVDVP